MRFKFSSNGYSRIQKRSFSDVDDEEAYIEKETYSQQIIKELKLPEINKTNSKSNIVSEDQNDLFNSIDNSIYLSKIINDYFSLLMNENYVNYWGSNDEFSEIYNSKESSEDDGKVNIRMVAGLGQQNLTISILIVHGTSVDFLSKISTLLNESGIQLIFEELFNSLQTQIIIDISKLQKIVETVIRIDRNDYDALSKLLEPNSDSNFMINKVLSIIMPISVCSENELENCAAGQFKEAVRKILLADYSIVDILNLLLDIYENIVFNVIAWLRTEIELKQESQKAKELDEYKKIKNWIMMARKYIDEITFREYKKKVSIDESSFNFLKVKEPKHFKAPTNNLIWDRIEQLIQGSILLKSGIKDESTEFIIEIHGNEKSTETKKNSVKSHSRIIFYFVGGIFLAMISVLIGIILLLSVLKRRVKEENRIVFNTVLDPND